MDRASTSKFEKVSMLGFGVFALVGILTFSGVDVREVNMAAVAQADMSGAIKAVDSYEDTKDEEIVPTDIRSEYSVTFRIAGDFMFARGVHRKFNNDPTLSLDKIGTGFFGDADANIVNLEGSISDISDNDIAPSGSFKFVFPRSMLSVLKRHGINVVSLANNHSFDNGREGFFATQKILKGYRIKFFGGYTDEFVSDVSIVKGTNLNLVLIGVHTLYQTPDITNIIKKYKANKSNRVLIMPHWGVEYDFKHSKRQEELAHSWIDAGADIVVGSHPHVVQDVGVYKGVPIIYSLGNFLFDQTEQNTKEKGVQDGMTLHGKFIKGKLALYAVPIRLENFQPQLIKNKKKKAKILKDFYKPWNKHATKINGVNMFVF